MIDQSVALDSQANAIKGDRMAESAGALGLASSRLSEHRTRGVFRRTSMGQVLACVFFGAAIAIIAKFSYLLLLAIVAGVLAVMIGCRILGHRPFAVFALVYSVPFSLMHHFVYIPNTGAADGLTIELVDVWILFLLADYAWSVRMGTAKPVSGLKAFCIPTALLLSADLFSFLHSANIELSTYGLLNHVRQAVLFIALAVILAQGKKECRAVCLAIDFAIITIGGICIAETILRTNVRPDVMGSGDDIFRAGGLLTPTGTAAYLAALLPVVAVEYLFPPSFSRRVLAGVGLCVGAAGLGCTLTRSAIGIFAVGLMPLLLFCFRLGRMRTRHVILLAVITTAVLLPWIRLGDRVSERAEDGVDSFNGRVALNRTAVNMASQSPLIGEGINNYEIKMRRFFPTDEQQTFEYLVHNKFLLTFAETGIVGLAAFLWLVAIALYRAFLLARRGLPLGIGMFCSVIIVVLSMNCESYEAGPLLENSWILIAAVAALWAGQFADAQRSAKMRVL